MVASMESTTSNNNTASNTNATQELYHTNLLRLQAEQLLSESVLPLCSQTGFLDKEVKWSKDVQEYIDIVQDTIKKIDAVDLSPDDVRLNSSNNNNNNNTKNIGNDNFWIALHSDKAKRHLEASTKRNGGDDKNNDKWKFLFPGGEYLHTSSINSYAAYGAGLTTATANANVIPTVDLAVLLPVKDRMDGSDDDDADDDAAAMISGKDYLNGRYFDVSYSFFL